MVWYVGYRIRCASLLSVACLLAGCSEPTAILLRIDGAGSEPALLTPADVDTLRVFVSEESQPAATRDFPLGGAARPLEETLVLRPGSAAGGRIHIEVSGLHGGVGIAAGKEDAEFSPGKIVEAAVHLAWLPSICLDGDGDGFGRGPGCAGVDCDDGRAGVHPGAREECNLLDDDCDGEGDEAQDLDPPRCELYKGVCREARQGCSGGEWRPCTIADYGEKYQDVETACDGFDNDCDGAVDEGCACSQGATRPCTGPDLGECRPGEQTCILAGSDWVWSVSCVGAVEPVQEICDQRDNDCDGRTDDDFDLQTDMENCGECGHACRFSHAQAVCQTGNCALSGCETGWYDINTVVGDGCEYECTPAQPPAEVCNGLDDDCDGLTDEDFDVNTSLAHCGECNHACAFPNGEGICQVGECVVTGCNDGWWDANGDGDDGCEYDCTPTNPPTEICDNLDNDCDGQVDGVTGDCTGGLVCIGGECTCPDADDDGHTAAFCGGDDCDDSLSDVHPGAREFCDDADTDCDGMGRDVAGQEIKTIDIPSACGGSWWRLFNNCGSISAAAAQDDSLGVAWACEGPPDGNLAGVGFALVDAGGNLVWSGKVIDTYAGAYDGLSSWSPRIAGVGPSAFIVTADVETGTDYFAVFIGADAAGLQESVSLSIGFILADLETVPWQGGRVAAIFLDNTSGNALLAQMIDSVPSLLGSPIATGLESGCCAHIGHELIRTPAGLLAVSCRGTSAPLHARWLTGPHLQLFGDAAIWRNPCGRNPQEIRGAWNSVEAGSTPQHRALVALFESCRVADLFIADVSQVGSSPVLESYSVFDRNYKDAAPVSTHGGGLAMVALRNSGEVVWLASDGTLAGLTETGDILATGVDFLDATAIGGGRVAIVMASASTQRVLIQLREGTCAP